MTIKTPTMKLRRPRFLRCNPAPVSWCVRAHLPDYSTADHVLVHTRHKHLERPYEDIVFTVPVGLAMVYMPQFGASMFDAQGLFTGGVESSTLQHVLKFLAAMGVEELGEDEDTSSIERPAFLTAANSSMLNPVFRDLASVLLRAGYAGLVHWDVWCCINTPRENCPTLVELDEQLGARRSFNQFLSTCSHIWRDKYAGGWDMLGLPDMGTMLDAPLRAVLECMHSAFQFNHTNVMRLPDNDPGRLGIIGDLRGNFEVVP